MPAYNPQPFVRVNGVTWTNETLEGVSITVGRNNVNEQPRAGYAQVTILTPDTANYPDIDIDEVIEIGVLDTSAAEKVLFTGQVSDIQVSLAAHGESGFLVSTAITAVGKLALLNRLGVGGSGYAQELDGVRIQNILDEALGLNYVEYGDYYDDNEVLPTRTNLMPNPSFETNLTGWAASRFTLSTDTTNFYVGNKALRGTRASAWGDNVTVIDYFSMPAAAGEVFTASAWVFCPLTNAYDYNFRLQLHPFTTTFQPSTPGATVLIPRGQWTRLTVTSNPMPAGTTQVMFRLNSRSSPVNMGVGEIVVLDGVLVEKAPAPAGDYFDGSLLATQPVYWTGTPHNSTSVRGGNAGTYVVADDQTWATLDPYIGTVDTGDYEIEAYTSGVTNAYALASQVAQSGIGVIYETADNRIAYNDAESRTNQTTFLDIPASVIIADGIQATQRLGDIANDITVDYALGSVQDDNQASIDVYGRLAAKVDTLLADATSANTLLTYYLDTKSLPRKTLDSLLIALHLDNMENTLRDQLLDVAVGMGIETIALPEAIYPERFTGFVEGWTWTITRNTLFLQLRVSEYLLSVIAEQWGQVDPAEAWNTISATLEWQEARVIS